MSYEGGVLFKLRAVVKEMGVKLKMEMEPYHRGGGGGGEKGRRLRGGKVTCMKEQQNEKIETAKSV